MIAGARHCSWRRRVLPTMRSATAMFAGPAEPALPAPPGQPPAADAAATLTRIAGPAAKVVARTVRRRRARENVVGRFTDTPRTLPTPPGSPPHSPMRGGRAGREYPRLRLDRAQADLGGAIV